MHFLDHHLPFRILAKQQPDFISKRKLCRRYFWVHYHYRNRILLATGSQILLETRSREPKVVEETMYMVAEWSALKANCS